VTRVICSKRSLRDKSDLFENDGNVIKFGPRHRFSVNTQELDLTILPRREGLAVHLTGTNYYEDIETPELLALKHVWDMTLVSESADLYRGAYLAGEILRDASGSQTDVKLDALRGCIEDAKALQQLVRNYAAPRYREGYERGIHDHDAALLLKQIIPMLERGDLLRFDPASRGLAQIFWANIKAHDTALRSSTKKTRERGGEHNDHKQRSPLKSWLERAQSARQLQSAFSSTRAVQLLVEDIELIRSRSRRTRNIARRSTWPRNSAASAPNSSPASTRSTWSARSSNTLTTRCGASINARCKNSTAGRRIAGR